MVEDYHYQNPDSIYLAIYFRFETSLFSIYLEVWISGNVGIYYSQHSNSMQCISIRSTAIRDVVCVSAVSPSSTLPAHSIKHSPPSYSHYSSPHNQPSSILASSKMKSFLASLALPLLAAAAPPFSVMAIRSASPIHYMQMNAAGQRFWLGGETASYCPDQVPDCPPGNQTVFAPGGNALVCTYITLNCPRHH